MAGYIGTKAVNLSTTGSDINGPITAEAGQFGTLVGGRAVVGGTANAITITTGLSLSALVSGMQIRFRTGGGNTGATTINVDGIGAVAAVTVTSAALPDGYIRSNIDTVITYNSPNWIVSREVESGSSANGDYTRWEDGTQICWGRVVTSSSGGATQTFPRNFVDDQVSVTGTAIFSTSPRIVMVYNVLAGSFDVDAWTVAPARQSPTVMWQATGKWY